MAVLMKLQTAMFGINTTMVTAMGSMNGMAKVITPMKVGMPCENAPLKEMTKWPVTPDTPLMTGSFAIFSSRKVREKAEKAKVKVAKGAKVPIGKRIWKRR